MAAKTTRIRTLNEAEASQNLSSCTTQSFHCEIPIHICTELTSVLVNRARELVDSRGGLQALVQDSPLALKANILGPPHKPRDIALGLNAVANAEVLRPLLEERALRILLGISLLGTSSRSRRFGRSLGHFQDKHEGV